MKVNLTYTEDEMRDFLIKRGYNILIHEAKPTPVQQAIGLGITEVYVLSKGDEIRIPKNLEKISIFDNRNRFLKKVFRKVFQEELLNHLNGVKFLNS